MSDEIGPALPPGFGQQQEDSAQSSDSEEDGVGPALPPGYTSSKKLPEEVGAPLPPQANVKESRTVGPTLPPGVSLAVSQSDSSEDEMIGPSLALAAPADAQYDVAEEFAARNRSLEAEQKRIENEKSQNTGGREEWMMSLPTLGLAQDIGLTARTFRNKAAPQQDSSWTKAPTDKQDSDPADVDTSKHSSKRRYEDTAVGKRDEEIAEKLGKLSDANRKESLYDMHQKKLKKEQKKAKDRGDKAERVPFSREADMQVNKFDEAQRKSVLKKAALLDTRFGHGSQKYE